MPHATKYQIEMSSNVPAATEENDPVVVERKIQSDGRITGFTVGWPGGADNLVGVRLQTKSGDKLFPQNKEDGYVAADNFTAVFPLEIPLKQDDVLRALFVNNDDTNNHFVNAIVNYSEDEVTRNR